MASATDQQQQQQQDPPIHNGTNTTTNGSASKKQPVIGAPLSGAGERDGGKEENGGQATLTDHVDSLPLPRVRAPAPAAAQTPLFSDGEEEDEDGNSDERSEAQDGDQATAVTSPSITSPPYWAHAHNTLSASNGGGRGHSRSISNASVDSVLPPDAITLQDNEYDDGPDGSNVYGRDRNRACWAKSVQITDYVLVNSSTTNIGAFVVWNIRVETLNGSYMNIRKRYSEFDDLRKRLVQTFPGFEAALPMLPPKSVISKFRPTFLRKRRAGLQYFLK